ncbi:MAG: right-handed parallel beta-helix repeat-containing protein [Candidatus Helarchaeota archaeon]
MKLNRILSITIIVMIIIGFSSLILINHPELSIKKSSFKIEININSIKPINITNNNEFATYASSGNGSKGNPYILENLAVDAFLTNPNRTFCININNTNAYFIIKNCTTFRGYYGIWLNNVSNGIIERNNFSSETMVSVKMTNCTNINITHNIMNEEKSYGIVIYNSSFNTIYNNTIFNNSYDGIRLWGNCTYNSILNNNIVYSGHGPSPGFGILIMKSSYNNISNNIIIDIGNDGIDIQNSTFNDLINNTIINAYKDLYTYGITLINSNFTKIINCNISNNANGIQLSDNSWNTTIKNNSIIRNYFGIFIGYSDNSSILNNTIFKNTAVGLHMEWSNNSIIKFNNISNCSSDGIYIQRCVNNIIYKNNISFNSGYGLQIINLAQNNVITYNWFFYNKYPTIYPTDANSTNTIENNTIVHIKPLITTTTTEPIPGFYWLQLLFSLSLIIYIISIIKKDSIEVSKY